MKIALLHLDVAEGPETRNRRSIISAAGEAVSRGADWIVTPETALQGYFFYDNNGKLPSFSEKQLSRYLFLPEGIKRICFFPQQNMMKGMERDTIPVLS